MNTRRIWTLAVIALVAVFGIAFGRPWIALGVHAQGYPVTGTVAPSITTFAVSFGETEYAQCAGRSGIEGEEKAVGDRQIIDAAAPGGGITRSVLPELASMTAKP